MTAERAPSARSFLSRRRARRSFSRSVRRDAWMLAHRGQTQERRRGGEVSQFLVLDRDGCPTWDGRLHANRSDAERSARRANDYFFNVPQPAYVVAEATPAVAYLAQAHERSQSWVVRHMDTLDRLRSFADEYHGLPHTHPAGEGEPACPACWTADVLRIIREGRGA